MIVNIMEYKMDELELCEMPIVAKACSYLIYLNIYAGAVVIGCWGIAATIYSLMALTPEYVKFNGMAFMTGYVFGMGIFLVATMVYALMVIRKLKITITYKV